MTEGQKTRNSLSAVSVMPGQLGFILPTVLIDSLLNMAGGVDGRSMCADWYNPLRPSGHYIYHQFNIQQFYVLPTQCIYVFSVDLRTKRDYFPIQH